MVKLTKIDEILMTKVSYQNNTWSEINGEISIKKAIEIIRNCHIESEIAALRTALMNNQVEEFEKLKKKLPSVTFSGCFNGSRSLKNLKFYNPIIVIDIDKIEDSMVNKIYSFLLSDKYVLGFWRSPSNRGFKGLVALEYKVENLEQNKINELHKCAFKKLYKHFQENYAIQLDISGSDVSRLCFLSADSNLVLKNEAILFEIFLDDIAFDTPKSPIIKVNSPTILSKEKIISHITKNDGDNRHVMSNIIRYLKNNKKSITNSYSDWFKVAMAISNSFTFDVGLKYFKKLSSLDTEKYNELECENFFSECYYNSIDIITFNSIVYLANKKGFLTKYQRLGVPKTGI